MALDFSKPLRTRNGARVTILCSNARGDMPIVGLVHNEKADETFTWKADGSFQPNGHESCLDLVYVDEHKVYLPVYDDGSVGNHRAGPVRYGYARACLTLEDTDPHARYILELVYLGKRLESVNIIRRGEVTP